MHGTHRWTSAWGRKLIPHGGIELHFFDQSRQLTPFTDSGSRPPVLCFVSPQNAYVEVLTSGTSSWGLVWRAGLYWGPSGDEVTGGLRSSMTSILKRRGNSDTAMSAGMMLCAVGSLAARSQGATGAEREARHGLLRAPVEGVRPSSQTSGLQNRGKIDVGCVNHSAPAALF